jgi:FxsC-like protein
VLVVLQSRAYFTSEFCGKELEVFRRRRERYVEDGGPADETPPLALPVLWDWPVQMPELPDVLKPVQYTNAELGENYNQLGLRTLATQSKYADDYKHFVAMFAESLVAAGQPNSLPKADFGSVRDLPSAFGPAPQKRVAALPGAAVTRYDRWTAWFIYVVGTADELRHVRQDVSTYADDDGSTWRPFEPDVSLPLKVLAAQAAAKESLSPERITLDTDLDQELEDAQTGQSFVLLLVDPWTARLKSYRDWLEKVDGKKTVNTEVIVAMSAADQETMGARDALNEHVQAVFWRSFTLYSSPVRGSTMSADSFEREVIAAINEIRKRLMQVGKLRRAGGGESGGSLPLPSGPGG